MENEKITSGVAMSLPLTVPPTVELGSGSLTGALLQFLCFVYTHFFSVCKQVIVVRVSPGGDLGEISDNSSLASHLLLLSSVQKLSNCSFLCKHARKAPLILTLYPS